jgi:outer membrane protein TolC
MIISIFLPDMVSAIDSDKKKGLYLTDALRQMLAQQADIKIQEEQVTLSRGEFQQEKGAFDTTFGFSAGFSHENTPLSPGEKEPGLVEESRSNDLTYSVSLLKKFRNGIQIEPSLQLTRTESKTFPVNQMADYDPANYGKVNLKIIAPLLKGFGKTFNTAGEKASELTYQKGRLELRYLLSENIFDAVSTYWNYRYTHQVLEQRKASENRANKLSDITEKLIRADERPASELQEIKANILDKNVLSIVAQQEVDDAKYQLGLLIGISPEKSSQLPPPKDPFITLKQNEIDALKHRIIRFSIEASRMHPYYQAAVKDADITDVNLQAAKHNLRNQLDLELNLGYNSLDESDNYTSMVSGFGENIPGYNASAMVNFYWPLKKNVDRGLLVSSKAAYNQALFKKRDLLRAIRINITNAFITLNNSYFELKTAEKAAALHRKALDNELKKFKLGMSTFLDLISTEERLTNALLSELSGKLKLNLTIAKFRFETNTFLSESGDELSIKNDIGLLPDPF